MATIDLGKIKFVFRDTYDNSASYVPDDVVTFTDGSVTSSYICKTATSGNNPSSGGTVHANWQFLAKGQAVSPTTTQGDLVFRGASADQRLAIGSAGEVLKVNSSANGYEFGAGGGMVKLASASLTGQTLSNLSLDYFTTTYRTYKFFFDGLYFSANAYPNMRMKKNADNQLQSGNQYTWLTGHPYMQNNGTKTSNVHGSYPTSNWHIHGDNQIHTSWSCAGELTFHNPMAGATRKAIVSGFTYGEESDTNQRNIHIFYGQALQAEDYKGLYIYPSSGTITAINYTLYGLIT